MSKRLKLILVFVALFWLIFAIHFIPVYNKKGNQVVDDNLGVCIDYDKIEAKHYRIIPNGINGFRSEKNLFIPAQDPFALCQPPINLRLYLW